MGRGARVEPVSASPTSATPETTGTTVVRNLWVACFVAAKGYRIIAAFVGRDGRCALRFLDPDSEIPEMTQRFFADELLQKIIDARHALTDVVAAVREAGALEGPALDAHLAPLAHPRRANTTTTQGGRT